MKIVLDVTIARQDPLLIKATFKEGKDLRSLYLSDRATTIASTNGSNSTHAPASHDLITLKDIFFRMIKNDK